MFRTLCILLGMTVVLCGCTPHQQSETFKEKYNVYAEIEIDKGLKLPIYHDSPETEFYQSQLLLDQYIPIKELEAFADAIVRRMDAKTLTEYHQIQDEIDQLHSTLRAVIHPPRENVGWHEILFEKKARDTLLHYYSIRDEKHIPGMLKTVQFARYLKSL